MTARRRSASITPAPWRPASRGTSVESPGLRTARADDASAAVLAGRVEGAWDRKEPACGVEVRRPDLRGLSAPTAGPSSACGSCLPNAPGTTRGAVAAETRYLDAGGLASTRLTQEALRRVTAARFEASLKVTTRTRRRRQHGPGSPPIIGWPSPPKSPTPWTASANCTAFTLAAAAATAHCAPSSGSPRPSPRDAGGPRGSVALTPHPAREGAPQSWSLDVADRRAAGVVGIARDDRLMAGRLHAPRAPGPGMIANASASSTWTFTPAETWRGERASEGRRLPPAAGRHPSGAIGVSGVIGHSLVGAETRDCGEAAWPSG